MKKQHSRPVGIQTCGTTVALMRKRKMTMKNKIFVLCSVIMLAAVLALAGCGSKGGETTGGAAPSGTAVNPSSGTDTPGVTKDSLEDGVYKVDVETDSNMFHINEAMEDKGFLSVEKGKWLLHITLPSKNIVNMYMGTAEEAEAAEEKGEALIEPVTDTVTYSDGTSEEVYGFVFPIDKLGEPITVAIIGTKDNWYTHEIIVSNPEYLAQN